jgi:hypothetical protein
MNGSDKIRIAREGLPRGGLLALKESGDVVLFHPQVGELEPRQRGFEVAPHARNRVQLRTIGWSEHQAYVGRKGAPLGGMGPAVVQEQEVQAVREGVCEGMHEHLEALGLQRRQCQEGPLTGRGCHGTIDGEPLKHVRHHADGLRARGGEAPPADGESTDAAVVLAEHPDRTGVRSRNRPWEVFMTGGLEDGDSLRLFWCGSGAAL